VSVIDPYTRENERPPKRIQLFHGQIIVENRQNGGSEEKTKLAAKGFAASQGSRDYVDYEKAGISIGIPSAWICQ
jgi:hypothetical protein